MLEIKSFTFGPFQTNTYVVSFLPSEKDENGFVLLIDPACCFAHEQQMLLNYINGLCPSGEQSITILATHGHLDHLWGAAWACKQWGVPVMLHPADIPMAQAMQQQYDLFGIPGKPKPFPVSPLDLSSLNCFSVIPTPGHTPGSVCLYWPEQKLLFSGDTLFQMGYGRTDLPGGNMGQLIESLNRLFELPPDTRVFPGHGDSTTIGAERR